MVVQHRVRRRRWRRQNSRLSISRVRPSLAAIKATRALLTAALTGELKKVEMRTDANFGFAVPVSVPGVDSKILDPRSTWADPAAYDAQAAKLAENASSVV